MISNKPSAEALLSFIKERELRFKQTGTKFRHKDLKKLKNAYDDKVLSESHEKGISLMNVLFHLKYGMSVRYDRDTKSYSVVNPFENSLMYPTSSFLLSRIKPMEQPEPFDVGAFLTALKVVK